MKTRRERFPVHTEVPVFFSDCDPMGHVNNARFFTYMEHARVQYYKKLKALDLRTMGPRTAFGFIVAEATCTFHSPALIDETLVVGVRISELKTRSFLMGYEIRAKKDRRLVVTGRTVQVMFDYRKGRSFPIPASLRRKVERLEGRKMAGAPSGRSR